MRFSAGVLICCVLGPWAHGQPLVPPGETLDPPTPARLAAIETAATAEGWDPLVAPLRAAAQRAYDRDRLAAAEAWLNVYRWARLWGTNQADYVVNWIQRVTQERVNHPNMPTRYVMEQRPLGGWLSPELRAWLLGNPNFSEEFFSVLQPVDNVPATLGILNDLYRDDPARFARYAQLALAIAVVYDVPPPPDWPHPQVAPALVPHAWPPPVEAFRWWAREDAAGRTFHRLAQLGADELKFVVDATASFDDLAWSEEVANYPLNQFARAYTMISYRRDRAAANIGMWPGRSYALPEILGTGGICIDQAYFAAQAGKARGVPTLLFRGAGNDGRHAWFGYLDGDDQWRLDAGRQGEQRFVTGFARDPQTWGVISDHELKFLAARFRARPTFQQSRVHEDFAVDLLAAGDAAAAERAARKAVNYERRNAAAWETLLAATAALGRDAKAREGVLGEAARAFARYPDLELVYVKRLADSLRARGQVSLADHEEQRLARKYRGERDDLSVEQARTMLLRSMSTQSLREQIRSYDTAVDTYGRRAGLIFFDQVVVVFVDHLLQAGERTQAAKAVEHARKALKAEAGGQLAGELDALAKYVKTFSRRE
ncbi:MAG TPA: hypothetical protein VHE13_09930 [Opitutus sp.]|nr:hypothetical protein [Opitutus sp.]